MDTGHQRTFVSQQGVQRHVSKGRASPVWSSPACSLLLLTLTAGFPLLAKCWWPVVDRGCATSGLPSGEMDSAAICWQH